MHVIKPAKWLLCFLLVPLFSNGAQSQSLDINAPSPISTNEVFGRITARDIGDARFTDHYYAFVGNQGDLVVTIDTKNLNGDVDVFTASGLRPLMKFTVYAEGSSPITKGVFLRRRENLILRVEARSPNDDDGTYQIRFSGSFEPLAASPFTAESERKTEDLVNSTRTTGTGRRVTSAGARIKEPEPPPAEVATAPTPEPTPAPTPAETTTEKAAEPKPTKTTPARTAKGGRRSTSRRTPRTKPTEEVVKTPSETESTTADTKPAEITKPAETPSESSEASTTPKTPTRKGSGRRSASREPAKPAAEPEPDVGPRLVIETLDGTLVDRSMSTVRRVMVENGQVVVVGKDGRVQRFILSDVVRMSIAP
jgi:hypothetical protein